MKLTIAKLTRNICRVLLILILVVPSTTSCGQNDKKYEKGFDYTLNPEAIMIGVQSNIDVFNIDDVSFDIYYGVHDINYNEKHDNEPKSSYLKEGNETVFFGVYICSSTNSLDVVNDVEISDYEVIDNYYFVKKISEEEAFSNEYGFEIDYLKGIVYNHSEKIVIPAEFFTEDTGSFVIKIVAFFEPTNDSENYYVSMTQQIKLQYQIVDKNTVKIVF